MNYRKTLTETLMTEEANETYRTNRYDKTLTSCMFGYASCSSGFGSGMGGPKIGRIGGPNSSFGITDKPGHAGRARWL